MCNYIVISAGMARMSLLSPDIEAKHRARLLGEKKLDPLITRTPREYWRIHPAWVERYVLYLFVSHIYLLIGHINLIVIYSRCVG